MNFQSNCDETGNVSLKLTSVTPEDKGVYTVKARNSLGEVKCFSNLIVKSTSSTDLKSKTEKLIHPAFKELFADRTVIIEDSTKFDCIVLGKPTPKVLDAYYLFIIANNSFRKYLLKRYYLL